MQVLSTVVFDTVGVNLGSEVTHAEVRSNVEYGGIELILGIDTYGKYLRVEVGIEAFSSALLHVVIDLGITDVSENVQLLIAVGAVETEAEEFEIVLGVVDIAAALGVTLTYIEVGTQTPAVGYGEVRA